MPEFAEILCVAVHGVAFEIAVVVAESPAHLVDVLLSGVGGVEHVVAALLGEIIVGDVLPVVDGQMEEMLAGEGHVEFVECRLLHVGIVDP